MIRRRVTTKDAVRFVTWCGVKGRNALSLPAGHALTEFVVRANCPICLGAMHEEQETKKGQKRVLAQQLSFKFVRR